MEHGHQLHGQRQERLQAPQLPPSNAPRSRHHLLRNLPRPHTAKPHEKKDGAGEGEGGQTLRDGEPQGEQVGGSGLLLPVLPRADCQRPPVLELLAAHAHAVHHSQRPHQQPADAAEGADGAGSLREAEVLEPRSGLGSAGRRTEAQRARLRHEPHQRLHRQAQHRNGPHAATRLRQGDRTYSERDRREEGAGCEEAGEG
mmetsp:Transcript_12747/g.21497  ORF Transcript_12747/g.21497 Transcript_12747/m.21497 type:complete len:200 (+) Transcript_12747:203-802(+)